MLNSTASRMTLIDWGVYSAWMGQKGVVQWDIAVGGSCYQDPCEKLDQWDTPWDIAGDRPT